MAESDPFKWRHYQGAETQVWLAVSDDPRTLVSGRYFHHEQIRDAHPAASNVNVQNGLLRACEQLAGATLASER